MKLRKKWHLKEKNKRPQRQGGRVKNVNEGKEMVDDNVWDLEGAWMGVRGHSDSTLCCLVNYFLFYFF